MTLQLFGQHVSAARPGPLVFFHISLHKANGGLVLRACLSCDVWCAIAGAGLSCCRCHVVGKVDVVPIVWSVAVDVAGGESVRNMSVLRN